MTTTCLLAYISTISSDEKKRINGLCIIMKNKPQPRVISPELLEAINKNQKELQEQAVDAYTKELLEGGII